MAWAHCRGRNFARISVRDQNGDTIKPYLSDGIVRLDGRVQISGDGREVQFAREERAKKWVGAFPINKTGLWVINRFRVCGLCRTTDSVEDRSRFLFLSGAVVL